MASAAAVAFATVGVAAERSERILSGDNPNNCNHFHIHGNRHPAPVADRSEVSTTCCL